jgi:hypothetical protein
MLLVILFLSIKSGINVREILQFTNRVGERHRPPHGIIVSKIPVHGPFSPFAFFQRKTE